MKTFVDFIKEGEDENIQYLKESNEEVDYFSEILHINDLSIKFELMEYPHDIFYFNGRRCLFELCQDELGINESTYNNLLENSVNGFAKNNGLDKSNFKNHYFQILQIYRSKIHDYFEKIFNRKLTLNKHKLTWVNVLFNPFIK